MKRKIISLARSTKVVTLPTSWCESNCLSKGDEVELHENLNSIIISPVKKEKQADIDITNLDPMIKRVLGAYYKAGYDILKITFSTQHEFEIIDEVVREEFIGFEIISQNNNTVIAKSISEQSIDEFNSMLRRMILIITSMIEETIKHKDSIIERKKVSLKDKDVNKIADYCRRMINKNSLISLFDTQKLNPPLYYIVEQLEKIGDEIRDLALLNEIPNADLLNSIYIYFNSFYDLFYRFELTKISSFGEKRYEIRDEIDNLIAIKPSNSLIIYRNILEKTFDMNGALIALNT